MIELVFSVCMIAQPDVCKNVHLTELVENITPQQCLLQGQQQIAKWSVGNPKWQVRRWGCSRVHVGERDA